MRILIVKLSSLGDIVHAMAAVQDIRRVHPSAQIDWVAEPAFAPLLSRMAGIGRIIPFGERTWRKLLRSPSQWASVRQAWQAFRADLRRDAYDWVIDLQGLSKSALVMRTARVTPTGQRVAMAHATDGSSYEAPTRWLASQSFELPRRSHAVTRSRLLCAQALGYAVPSLLDFGLRAKVNGNNSPAAFTLPPRTVMLAHGCSRPDKAWPVANWQQLGERLIAAGYTLALPHAHDAEAAWVARLQSAWQQSQPAAPIVVLPRFDIAALTDVMAQSVGVIGVDSGLSHIAVALDLPHVQIYNFDTAWRTGPLHKAHQQAVVAQPTPTVDAVWALWQQVSATAESAVSSGQTHVTPTLTANLGSTTTTAP